MRGASTNERLQALQRDDKWFLSCGDGILWAPPFPTALHRPGYWDEALVYHHSFVPLFSVAVVGPDGDDIPLARARHVWQPDRLTTLWRAGESIALVEERYARPGGLLTSLWRRADSSDWGVAGLEDTHLVAFSAQPGETVYTVAHADGYTGLLWHRTLFDRHGAPLEVRATLSTDGDIADCTTRVAALRSEGSAALPVWRHTPFWDTWNRGAGGGLKEGLRLDGVSMKVSCISQLLSPWCPRMAGLWGSQSTSTRHHTSSHRRRNARLQPPRILRPPGPSSSIPFHTSRVPTRIYRATTTTASTDFA